MIPTSIQNLFWEINPSTLDVYEHQRFIITRALNYGTLKDWRWLAGQYGREKVAEVARVIPRTSVRRQAQRLAELLFK